MTFQRDVLWKKLDDIVTDAEHSFVEYDSQVKLKRIRCPDYDVLIVHYTRDFSEYFIIRSFIDILEITEYLDICKLWP